MRSEKRGKQEMFKALDEFAKTSHNLASVLIADQRRETKQ
jgi:hypothetical protein